MSLSWFWLWTSTILIESMDVGCPLQPLSCQVRRFISRLHSSDPLIIFCVTYLSSTHSRLFSLVTAPPTLPLPHPRGSADRPAPPPCCCTCSRSQRAHPHHRWWSETFWPLSSACFSSALGMVLRMFLALVSAHLVPVPAHWTRRHPYSWWCQPGSV